MRPASRNTGRPETVASTSPGVSFAPRVGRLVTIRGPSLRGEGVTPSARGEPKCAVPRVTTLVDSTRSTTGTRIGEAAGGAVRAATSAGEWIWTAAAQVASEETATALTMSTTRFRRRIALATFPAGRVHPRPGDTTHGRPVWLTGP